MLLNRGIGDPDGPKVLQQLEILWAAELTVLDKYGRAA